MQVSVDVLLGVVDVLLLLVDVVGVVDVLLVVLLHVLEEDGVVDGLVDVELVGVVAGVVEDETVLETDCFLHV